MDIEVQSGIPCVHWLLCRFIHMVDLNLQYTLVVMNNYARNINYKDCVAGEDAASYRSWYTVCYGYVSQMEMELWNLHLRH